MRYMQHMLAYYKLFSGENKWLYVIYQIAYLNKYVFKLA